MSTLPYCTFALLALAEAVAICLLNQGSFIYPLDDAYIHLALAERIGAGTYGINLGEFAAPASSILWPFLLSLFSRQSYMALAPCLLNLAAALGTLVVMARITRGAVETGPQGASSLWVTAFVTLLIPATNLVPLAVTGMEHSLQQLLAVLIVAGLINESKTTRAPPYLWVAVVLIPLVRYDSLALSVPALFYLGWRRHFRGSAVAALILAGALAAFSGFLELHGLGLLPASVLAKSDLMRTSGAIAHLFRALYVNLVISPQGNLLLLGCVILLVTAVNRSRPRQERGLAASMAAALLLHLTFGRIGAYFRYEAYLAAATLLMLIHLHRDWLAAAFHDKGAIQLRAGVLGILAAVSVSYGYALVSTPLAANNIYDQQYQMHRFVVDFYKGPVAVNDLGWAAFRNPHYVLDFGGLASLEALRARASDPSGQWMERLCREHGVDLILIYDSWFPEHAPDWIRLGSLKLLRSRITPSDPVVQFYARDAAAAARARLVLSGFAQSLPPGAAFIPTATP